MIILKVCVLLACVASGAEARTQYACVYKQSNKAPSGSANLFIVVDEKTGEIGTWDSFLTATTIRRMLMGSRRSS